MSISLYAPYSPKMSLNTFHYRVVDVGNEGRYLTHFYDKSPFTHRKTQRATRQHTNATQNIEYTTIADRLRMVSWGNKSHLTGVVKPVNGIPTFQLTAKTV